MLEKTKTKNKFIIKALESRVIESGSEDPKIAFTLEKCKEYIPGKVDTQKNTINCEIKHNKEWMKVIKDR